MTGSGMFGSPWVRMQLTKARAGSEGLAVLAVLAPFAAAGPVVVVAATQLCFCNTRSGILDR
jgi:hypothetical protein